MDILSRAAGRQVKTKTLGYVHYMFLGKKVNLLSTYMYMYMQNCYSYSKIVFILNRISLKRGQMLSAKIQGGGNPILKIGKPIAGGGGGQKHPLTPLK